MAEKDTPKATSHGLTGVGSSITLQLVVSLIITGWVWFELWQGAVPSIENDVGLLIAVGLGLGFGVSLSYGDTQGLGRRYFEDTVTFLLIMTVLIGLDFLFFPEGLPPTGEIGLVVFVWTSVVAHMFFVYTLSGRESD
ncbi:hypothetical protein NDI54_12350 [Haloarcula sp. S1AR25-5A]|uniref:Uncharacterized protein n=1 Tax=Haloarcula terrestris TaxID=2950533 RepID=A0AAE4JJM4_9EURY|nr:hypothetical protein [Haloarcula terrestris]MDS0222141.1 hypothetical protein [Haloarcula terrestris]